MSSFAWQSARLSALTVALSFVAICGCENASPVNTGKLSGAETESETPSGSANADDKAGTEMTGAETRGEEKTGTETASAENANTENADTEKAAEAKKAETPPATGVQLDVASWEETQAIIAEHKGKVVVIDLWSTFCAPCVKEFPNLVAIHEKYGDKVVCLSLNCNYSGVDPHDVEKVAVSEFLTAQKAHFRNLMNREEDTELYKKVGIASIPVVQVYGRDGKLAKQFDNEKEEYGKDGFTYHDHIVPFVESLVKE